MDNEYHPINSKILENLLYFRDRDIFTGEEISRLAVMVADLECLKFLNEEKIALDSGVFTAAAYTGNLEIMKWLLQNNCPWDEWTFRSAAQHGDLENMKWLLENGCPLKVGPIEESIKGNHDIENIIWLKNQGCPVSIFAFKEAAENGNIEHMKWCIENDCCIYECINWCFKRGNPDNKNHLLLMPNSEFIKSLRKLK